MAEPQPTATVGQHPCPECGGALQWNAARQSLVCPYCGTALPRTDSKAAPAGAAAVEQDLQAALAHPAGGRGWGGDPAAPEKREVQCQNCQAISVFVDGIVARRCDFCGSPAIVAHHALNDPITPQSLLPFKVSEAQMRGSLRQWYGSRWFAPNTLKSAALTDTLRGVYLPYWTFDAQASATWQADAGHHYFETESFRDGQGSLQSRQVQRIRWEPASGSLAHFFDDSLVPGTRGVHPGLLRQIEPFPTLTDLQPYSPEFVRGWTVERYQIDLGKAEKLNQQAMQAQLRLLCGRQVPGDTFRNLQVDARFQGRTFKHVLVPVWLVSYTYGARSFQVLGNGHNGTLAGEQPYSWAKIALAVLAALLLMWLAAAMNQ